MDTSDLKFLKKCINNKVANLTPDEVERFIRLYKANSCEQVTLTSISLITGYNHGWLCIIKFDDGFSLFFTGLSFGYGGGGPNTLKDILIAEGVDPVEADKVRQKQKSIDNKWLRWRRGSKLIIEDF